MQSQVQLAAQREINQEISFLEVQPCVLPNAVVLPTCRLLHTLS